MKKFLCLVALLVASVSLASCVMPGVGTGGGAQNASGKTTITFWHAMGQANQAVIDIMIESFEKAYPMFDVEQTSQGGYTDLRDKILYSVPVGESLEDIKVNVSVNQWGEGTTQEIEIK